ncbi:hypothetical protein ABZ924_21345 [Streptomyces sp. NPDC046876]|uniref:terpene synthase family protein n=1 Tax=Streptomyces sp. NPDC046876 TaxID=3155616 RepID=UPI0033FF7BB3
MPASYATGAAPSRIGWQLPPFYCPFERDLIHPKAAELEERAVAWIDGYGLYPDATERAWCLATRSADFTARIIPYGDVETMLLFTQWNYWAFAMDDRQDSGAASSRTATVADQGARLVRAVEAPGSGLLPPGPFTAALEDLVVRTREILTPVQLHRFTEGIRDWVFGSAWQAVYAQRGAMPSLNEYVAMRTSDNGTRFTLAWCNAANGIELPSRTLYSAPVQVLTEAAGLIVGCDNDVFSYNKDDHQEPLEENLINVLAQERGLGTSRALEEAVAFRDRLVGLFVALRDRVARDAGEELLRYLRSLEHWIAGDIEYHNRAPRYTSPRNRNALPVEGASYDITYRATPSDPRTGPLPVPALAWWWRQLEG